MNAIELGRVFRDEEVAALYRYRPPYPREIFDILSRLLVEPRTVLDAGAGTGALAREMVGFAARVDALDPSTAMVAEGKRLPRGDDPRLRWSVGRAEDGPVDPPYGLITCGASLHWMDLDVALPRFRELLAPGARLAIVDTENEHPLVSVREEVLAVIRGYSPLTDHVGTKGLIAQLVSQGRLRLEGEARTAPMPFEQPVDDFVRFLGSTSTLSRATLGARAAAFERDVRAVFARHAVQQLYYGVVGIVAWGRPIS